MKYYLTVEQYKKLWSIGNLLPRVTNTQERINFWSDHMQPKFNIEYTESFAWEDPAEYGVLIGEEKDINWFLLHDYC